MLLTVRLSHLVRHHSLASEKLTDELGAETLELSNPVLRGLRRSNLLTAACDFITAQIAE
ncbi:MAG: hypothetical protein M1G31_00805 [Pseudanabaena sp. Salubria-1]|nr:hypothetical protein [Pseudanabaena sp. Salubria-1]